MTITCKEVSRLVSEGLDRNLPAKDKLRVYAHLAICLGCRSINQRFAFLRRAMREIASRGNAEEL